MEERMATKKKTKKTFIFQTPMEYGTIKLPCGDSSIYVSKKGLFYDEGTQLDPQSVYPGSWLTWAKFDELLPVISEGRKAMLGK
jgi:hypothetical protein